MQKEKVIGTLSAYPLWFSELEFTGTKIGPKIDTRGQGGYVVAPGSRITSNYMVKGWLDRNCLSMFYGPSNAGKAFVALDIAMHIAAGKPWRGLKVNGGPVLLYIAAEGGAGKGAIAKACSPHTRG
jgi:hypothetical protein